MWAENVCQHLAARRATNWRARSNEVSIAKGLNRFLLCITSVANVNLRSVPSLSFDDTFRIEAKGRFGYHLVPPSSCWKRKLVK